MTMHDLQSIQAAVKEVCGSEPVRLAYLHGSYVRGHTDAESDIDIAILADPALSKEQRRDLRLHLMERMAGALRVDFEKVDLVILQDVPPLLKYNAVRKGICIFEHDRSERNLFDLKVEQEYDDERYYLERENQMTIDRILSSPSV